MTATSKDAELVLSAVQKLEAKASCGLVDIGINLADAAYDKVALDTCCL